MNNVQRIVSSILKITAGLVMAVATTASAQTFTLLHSFAGAEGANPMGSLILSNGALYGMTSQGGVAGSGVVFKMNTNGSGCPTCTPSPPTRATGSGLLRRWYCRVRPSMG